MTGQTEQIKPSKDMRILTSSIERSLVARLRSGLPFLQSQNFACRVLVMICLPSWRLQVPSQPRQAGGQDGSGERSAPLSSLSMQFTWHWEGGVHTGQCLAQAGGKKSGHLQGAVLASAGATGFWCCQLGLMHFLCLGPSGSHSCQSPSEKKLGAVLQTLKVNLNSDLKSTCE